MRAAKNTRILHLDSHHRLLVAGVVAAVGALGFFGHASLATAVCATWDFFSFSLVVLAWITILTAHPREVRRTARLQDDTQTLIFVFVIFAACASLLALIFLLAVEGSSKRALAAPVILAVVTVSISWVLVHTSFALRYAHAYYSESSETTKGPAGGLDFPNERQPDYLDFSYFSFVIGMTCQVSDVQVTGRSIRRLALFHGLISFVFNTAIVALGINVISGLIR